MRDKFWISVILGLVVSALMALVFQAVDANNECKSAGGVMVKSYVGYYCIDKKVLLK